MSSTIRRARNLDAESGKDRTQGKRSKKAQPPPPDSESEPEYVDTDLESQLEIKHKDTSVMKKKKSKAPRPSRSGNHGVEGEEESGSELAEQKAKENDTKVAPHMLMLLAATYHIGFSSIVRPDISSYIPDCYNFFSMAYYMMELASENTYLNEMVPGFTSIGFYTYCGFLYYYQILRAREYVGNGQLTRIERRVLRILKTIGEPENWPVPAPLIAFVQALGIYKSSNPVYSWVIPRFPDFSGLTSGATANQGLTHLDANLAYLRIPMMPALIEFLRLFGNNTAQYRTSHGWVPTNQTQGELDATHTFLGIADSAATSVPFQMLAFCSGWNQPTEGEMRQGTIIASNKRNAIRRWNISTVLGNYTNIEEFTQLNDTKNTSWIRHLIAQINVLNRFFPGSTNLGAIDPITNLGTLTKIDITVGTARTARDHAWYRGRKDWQVSFNGYDDSEQGRILSRLGIATGVTNSYDDQVIPMGASSYAAQGPFFVDAANPNAQTERHEQFRNEGMTTADPAARFIEQLSNVYDPSGARK